MVLVEDADKDNDSYKQRPVYPAQMITLTLPWNQAPITLWAGYNGPLT